jgi:hypothetical protein
MMLMLTMMMLPHFDPVINYNYKCIFKRYFAVFLRRRRLAPLQRC